MGWSEVEEENPRKRGIRRLVWYYFYYFLFLQPGGGNRAERSRCLLVRFPRTENMHKPSIFPKGQQDKKTSSVSVHIRRRRRLLGLVRRYGRYGYGSLTHSPPPPPPPPLPPPPKLVAAVKKGYLSPKLEVPRPGRWTSHCGVSRQRGLLLGVGSICAISTPLLTPPSLPPQETETEKTRGFPIAAVGGVVFRYCY